MASSDVPLFLALERIVFNAGLSRSEAALMAGELESVSLRWEPPDLVLSHLSARLDGLKELYEVTQEYSRLLLLVDMLLTAVAARMVGEPSANRRGVHPSGLRPIARAGAVPLRIAYSRKVNGR